MFEGRPLKANEFVNELLWTNEWDGYAASRTLGGWGGAEEQDVSQVAEKDDEEQEEDDDDNNNGVAQLETRTDDIGEEGAAPLPPSLVP